MPIYGDLQFDADGFISDPYQGTVGRELAQGVIEHVRSVPEAHDQSVFQDHFGRNVLNLVQKPVCGSSACLAGWVGALHTGVVPRFMAARFTHPTDQYASNYAAMLVAADPEQFYKRVYSEGDSEAAIAAFCELTGAIDPGWSQDMLRLRAKSIHLGFMPVADRVALARILASAMRAHPERFINRISMESVMIAAGVTDPEVIREHCREPWNYIIDRLLEIGHHGTDATNADLDCIFGFNTATNYDMFTPERVVDWLERYAEHTLTKEESNA